MAIIPREGAVEVLGARIHYLRWGSRGLPGLVLVHGGGAHVQWWSFLAPFFAGTHDVVALDLSGHGDSAHRASYRLEGWAAEVLAVVAAMEFPAPPVDLGHSLGGLVTIAAAASPGAALAGAIIVDSLPKASSRDRNGDAPPRPPHKRYPSLAAGMARFRLIPSQPCENDFILEHLARASLRPEGDGWVWKFDPHVFSALSEWRLDHYLPRISSRFALVRGEHSELLTAEGAAMLRGWLGRPAPTVVIPSAHHHLILDQPLAFVAAVRALLAGWVSP